MDKTVKIIVVLIFKNYLYDSKAKKFDFFDIISKDLPKNIIRMIYIEIINKCFSDEEDKDDQEREEDEQEDNKYDEMIEYIFGKIVNEMKNDDDINNIIKNNRLYKRKFK